MEVPGGAWRPRPVRILGHVSICSQVEVAPVGNDIRLALECHEQFKV